MIYLSCIATVGVLSGVYYIAKLKLRGQYILLLADFTWLTYSLFTHQYPLTAQSIVLSTLNIMAIRNWRAKGIEL